MICHIFASLELKCFRIFPSVRKKGWGKWSFWSSKLDILTSPLICRLRYLIFLRNPYLVCSCLDLKKKRKKGSTCRSKGSHFVSSHICFSYLFIPFYIFSGKLCRNKSPGNGWNCIRQSLNVHNKGHADANAYPGGATILSSCSTRM